MTFNEISSYKPLLECIDDHLDWGRTWEKLRPTDIEELTGLILKAVGKDAYLCIAESDDCDVIMAEIAKHMISGDNRYDISEIISKAAIKYFWNELEEVFTDRQQCRDQDRMLEAGLRPWIDKQNGEVTWSRA